MVIVFATSNAHKVEEVNSLLDNSNVVFHTLKDINWTSEIVENGSSFHQNALIKARTLFDAGHPIVLAEDSGLRVDALNGAPGIYSARYAGEDKNASDNNALLLDNLSNETNRSASFITVICFIYKAEVHFFEGVWQGKIAEHLDGKEGFGYDPLFIPVGYDITVAALGNTTKRKVSHRAKAFLQFKAYLQSANLQ